MIQTTYYWILDEAPTLELGQKTVGSVPEDGYGVLVGHSRVPSVPARRPPPLPNAKETVLPFINI